MKDAFLMPDLNAIHKSPRPPEPEGSQAAIGGFRRSAKSI